MISPVIQAESSEARKTTTRAMSAGVPRRPSGVDAMTFFPSSPSNRWRSDVPSDSVVPGATALTRTFRGARSSARPRVRLSMAAFVDE